MRNVQKDLLDAFASSGLTYDELARRTNIPKSALYRYLNGDTEKIPIDRFQAICSELRLDAGTLLGWKGMISPSSAGIVMSDIFTVPPDSLVISSDEAALVSSYRSLSPKGKSLLIERSKELELLYGKKSEDHSAQLISP